MEAASTIWDILPNDVSRPSLSSDLFWADYERQATESSIHIAILSKSYLELILDYEKTIESRFSVYRRKPYNQVKKGDVLLFKKTGGPIEGVGYVSEVWFYEMTDSTLNLIRERFGDEMRIQDQAFWDKCKSSSYATLIKLEHVRRIDSIEYSKRDRNAWVIFDPSRQEPRNLQLF